MVCSDYAVSGFGKTRGGDSMRKFRDEIDFSAELARRISIEPIDLGSLPKYQVLEWLAVIKATISDQECGGRKKVLWEMQNYLWSCVQSGRNKPDSHDG